MGSVESIKPRCPLDWKKQQLENLLLYFLRPVSNQIENKIKLISTSVKKEKDKASNDEKEVKIDA